MPDFTDTKHVSHVLGARGMAIGLREREIDLRFWRLNVERLGPFARRKRGCHIPA